MVIAGDLLRDSFPLVPANASLIEALERFSHHDGERLPVVSHDRQLVGSIAKTDVILALAGSTVRSATTDRSPRLALEQICRKHSRLLFQFGRANETIVSFAR